MKKGGLILFVLIGLIGCTPKGTTTKSTKKKEVSTITEALNMYETNLLNFEDLTAKVKADYEDDERSLNLRATIKIEKDEKIWLSAGMFGFEGARVLITPTRVQGINRLEKTYYDEPVEKLQELAGLPVDFQSLQNLLLGQIVFMNEKETSYTATPETVNIVTTIGKLVNNFSLAKPTYVLTEQIVDDSTHNLSMAVHYRNYQEVEGRLFPYQTDIQVTGDKPVKVNLEVQRIELNTNPSFNFSINKKYKRETIN